MARQRAEKKLTSEKTIKPKFMEERLQNITPLVPLNPLQAQYIKYIQEKKLIIATGYAGTSKAQPLYSKILTTDGWKTMGDMTVGTEVITPTNAVAKVEEVHKFHDKPVYTITFESGRTVDACEDHLWKVHYSTQQSKKNNFFIMSTKSIIERLNSDHRIGTYIPMCGEIGYDDDINYTISPYVMGVLLTIGSLDNQMTITTKRSHVIKMVEQWCKNNKIVLSQKNSASLSLISTDLSSNILFNEIKRLKLADVPLNERFIPDEYLDGSISQRWELLQGMMDASGNVISSKMIRDPRIILNTLSKKLMDQTRDLVLSLGGYAKELDPILKFKYNVNNVKAISTTLYKLQLKHSIPTKLFSAPTKTEKLPDKFNHGKTILVDKIVDITYKNNQDVWCIKIDDPEHLYLTNDYIVTHNTYIPTVMACDMWRKGEIDQIFLTRPNISSSKSLGFFSGSLVEKMMNWLLPVLDIMYKRLGRNVVEIAIKNGDIAFVPLETIKGMSFGPSTFVICDEAEDVTVPEAKTIITRQGGGIMVLAGDLEQSALDEKSGLRFLKNVVESNPDLEKYTGFVDFNRPSDIVRSPECKAWILALKNYKG